MKKILLENGEKMIVDDEDYEMLLKLDFWVSDRGIVIKPKSIGRFIMNIHGMKGFHVDHINGNFLDNRKGNLRVCTSSQNQMNRRLMKNNTSGYRGVLYVKDRDRW